MHSTNSAIFQCFSGCEFLEVNEDGIHLFCDRKLESVMLESLYYLRKPFFNLRKAGKPFKATSNTNLNPAVESTVQLVLRLQKVSIYIQVYLRHILGCKQVVL